MKTHRLSLPLAVVIGYAGAATVGAEDVEVDAPGTTIRVGPDHGASAPNVRVRAPGVRVNVDPNGRVRTLHVEGPGVEVQTQPTFWIGLLGGEISPELRAHLGDAVEDPRQGVIVRRVLPKSPAEEAGVKEHDILLFANGEPITGMDVLVDAVNDVGPSGGQITIELLRSGKQETVWVKPSERPAPVRQPGFREGPGGFGFGGFGRQGELPFNLRIFGGNGAVGNGNVQVQTNGVSVNVVTRDGKTHVNVKQLGEDGQVANEWDVDATDPKALEQLPPDVRATVESVLTMRGNVDVDIDVEEMIPNFEGFFGRRDGQGLFGRRDRRLEELQRQVEELQRRVLGEVPPPAEGDPAAGEAPRFSPQSQAPVEVEIPADDSAADAANNAGHEADEEK